MTIDNDTIRDLAGVPDPQVIAPDEAESTEEAEVEEQETETQPETDESVETATDEGEKTEEEEEVDKRHVIDFRRNDEEKQWELEYGEDGRLTEDSVTTIRTMLEKEGLEVTAQRAVEAQKETQKQLEAERAKFDALNVDLSKAEVGAKRWKELNENPQALGVYNRFRQQSRQAPIDPAKDKLEAEVATQKRQLDEAEYKEMLRQASDFANNVAEEFMSKNPDITPELCMEIGDHMAKLGVHIDYSRPFEEQRPRFLNAFTSGRDIFIGQGRIKNPEIVKAEKANEETERKLRDAKKRQAIRNPSAGGGPVGSKGKGKERRSMRGISHAGTAKLYREAQE